MSKSQVITARIDEDVLEQLDRLADHYDRSRAWLVAEAVKQYVAQESAFLAFLQEGEDAIARGDYVTHDELVAEIEAMKVRKAAA